LVLQVWRLKLYNDIYQYVLNKTGMTSRMFGYEEKF